MIPKSTVFEIADFIRDHADFKPGTANSDVSPVVDRRMVVRDYLLRALFDRFAPEAWLEWRSLDRKPAPSWDSDVNVVAEAALRAEQNK